MTWRSVPDILSNLGMPLKLKEEFKKMA